MKYCYIDVETTGLDSKRHGIIQLAAIMEIAGKEVSRYSEKIRPASSCAADKDALKISGNTVEMILDYQPEALAYRAFVAWLGEHIDKFSKSDKTFFCGYNSSFDNQFVREFFARNNDPYFGSWFWSGEMIGPHGASYGALWRVYQLSVDLDVGGLMELRASINADAERRTAEIDKAISERVEG